MISDELFFEKFKNSLITDIQVIGTHDSACYQLICGNTNVQLVKYLNPIRFVIPCVNKIIKDWTLTQNKTLYEQLENGIRAFDLRLTYDPRLNDFFFSHTFYCVRANEALEEIKKYFDTHPLAFLILTIKPDFEHQNTYTLEAANRFKNMIKSILGDFFINRGVIPTLKNCIETKKQILCGFLNESNPNENWIWGSEAFYGLWCQDTDDERFYQYIKGFVQYNQKPGLFNHIPLVKTPTTEIIKEDIKNRILSPCKYESQSLLSWSHQVPIIMERLEKDSKNEGFPILTNIFWIDFP